MLVIFWYTVHTEKSFQCLIKSTRNQIVFTIFRLIWIQMNRKMVNTIWFRFDLIRFRKKISVCTKMARTFWSGFAVAQFNICTPECNQPVCSTIGRMEPLTFFKDQKVTLTPLFCHYDIYTGCRCTMYYKTKKSASLRYFLLMFYAQYRRNLW